MKKIKDRKVLTKLELIQGFRDIGLSSGMFVEVHSSLSSFGYVEGGAETVISSLKVIVGECGALIMPSFPMSLPQTLTEVDKKL